MRLRASSPRAALVAALVALGSAACTALTGITDLNADDIVDGGNGGNSKVGDAITSDVNPSSASSSSSSGGVDASSSSSSSSSGEAGHPLDATTDAVIVDPPPPPSMPVLFQCVPLLVDTNQGLNLSATAWPGFRFQVTGTKAVTVTSLGFRASVDTSGKIFGAIVKLDSLSDQPNTSDLSSSDVLTTVVIDLPAASTASQNISAPISITLDPGFYAVAFGVGAHGAPAGASGTLPFQAGSAGCTNNSLPFTEVQTSAMFVQQAATPHIEVRGTVPQ